ncbi:MAG: stage V sporulation protein D [Oscillospiraceae bacterium]|nr:stage V sporulation protein D [Oscillospiraceae bacterium]
MVKGTTTRMRKRSLAVLITLAVVCFAGLIGRLFKLQIIDGENLQKMALEQQTADIKINAQRGTIYSRNMKVLAQSATVWAVILEPAYLDTEEKRELVCTGLHDILGVEKSKLLELAKKKSFYAIIKKRIESDVKDKIIEFKTINKISGGIRLVEDYKRYYPLGSFAAAVLGFTGTDGQGLSGIEAYYDKTLKGDQGRVVTAKNARGTDMPFDFEQMIPAQNGYHLKLCIDETVQHFVEKNLEEGVINNKVINRAAAIAMDVQTGEILSMAVKGDFDPNNPFEIADKAEFIKINSLPEEEKTKAEPEALQKQWRNKAVSDTYYPGSVFKMFTASMGFELNVVNENTPFYCSGKIKPYEKAQYIRCHKRSGHGPQTFLEALCHSCNPAFIMLGQKIGTKNFFEYYKAFGFHEKTNIDLPGESGGLFFNADGSMTLMDLAVASMGQNFGVTPIQMITGVSSIANGGKLMQPHVVKEILDSNGNVVKSIEPTVKRMTISENTSKRIIAMLRENAAKGSAKNAYVPGYRVAGKTGTSEKIGLNTPGQKDYISSFCGFAPADDPKIALLVFFDTPRGDFYYGSAVAAPVFAKIMQDVLPYLGIEKKYTEEELKKLDSKTQNVVR